MDLNDEKLVAIDSYIKEKLSSDGYNHSRGVMERAIEYANIHGGNEQYAAYAGLIHDVAKEVYEIAKKNLDEAMISTLKRTINFVLERDRLVHPKTIDAYNYMILNNKEKRD